MARVQSLKHLVAIVLAVLAAGVWTLLVFATYGMTSEHGFDAGEVKPFDVGIVLLLAGMASLLPRGARDGLGARRPTTAVLAASVLTAFAGGTAASAMAGGAAHDRTKATGAGACSSGDRQLLATVDFPGFREGPHGEPEGGCVLRLFPEGGPATAVADLTAALERDGWRSAKPAGEKPTFEHQEGAVMTLTTVSDDKATEVVLDLR
jgi:hypothetical protein